jgi:hypothetical protein
MTAPATDSPAMPAPASETTVPTTPATN